MQGEAIKMQSHYCPRSILFILRNHYLKRNGAFILTEKLKLTVWLQFPYVKTQKAPILIDRADFINSIYEK